MTPLTKRIGLSTAILACATMTVVSAQSTRDTLRLGIEAFDDFREDEAIVLLRQGLNPGGGERDSLWTAGLQLFVQLLLDRGEEEQAWTWLRWAWRHTPGLEADERMPPHVLATYDQARAMVQEPAVDETVTNTSWDWTPAADAGAQGTVRFSSDGMSARPTVVVQGVGVVPPNGTLSLPPGTYTLEASAAGYETAEVVREVLPGITTAVRYSLMESNPGVFYIASEPWGVVYVDGERIGYTTIAAFPLRSGTHTLRVERDGYVPFDTSITIQRDQQLRLGTVRLRPEGRPR